MENVLIKKNEANEILAKCKVIEKPESLKFVELTRDVFKDNKEILNKYFKNECGQECYYANLLAFKNVKSTLTLLNLKNILRKDFGKQVSLAGYKYNPEHYKFKDEYSQMEYEEDLFRDPRFEEIEKTYIEGLNFDDLETLYKVLFKAIKQRYVIILNLDGIPNILNNAIDCFMKGISCAPSNYLMRSKINEIRKLMENGTVIEWLATGASDMSLDASDYVNTYQKVLRQLTDIKNEPLDFCKELIHNEYDIFEEDILNNEYLEISNYTDNVDYEDEED